MPDTDRLVALLRQKVDQITGEAAAHDGLVAPETLGELERLARLVDVIERTRPVRRPARWPVVLVLVVTLTLVSLLLFLRVAETDIELDLVVSQVGFALTQPQVVTAIANLAELRASGLRGIQLPDAARNARTDPPPTEAEDSILLTTAGDASRRGTIALAPINVARGTELPHRGDRIGPGVAAGADRREPRVPGDAQRAGARGGRTNAGAHD
jgi:predicted small lipoprotein YifL